MSLSKVKLRRRHRRKRLPLNPISGAYWFMAVVLAIGVVLGTFAANAMGTGLIENMSESIATCLSDMAFRPNSAAVFKESMFKHSRMIALAWILSFVSAGAFVQIFLIAYKGFSIGYMVSVFAMEFGKKGLLISAGLFLVQNLGLAFILMFITQPMLVSAMGRIWKKQRKSEQKKQPPMGLPERIIILLICLMGCMVIAFYEAYICPVICRGLVF